MTSITTSVNSLRFLLVNILEKCMLNVDMSIQQTYSVLKMNKSLKKLTDSVLLV